MSTRPDRTSVDEEDMAVLAIAWVLLTSGSRMPEETASVTPPWRFSGRWFDSSRRVV